MNWVVLCNLAVQLNDSTFFAFVSPYSDWAFFGLLGPGGEGILPPSLN